MNNPHPSDVPRSHALQFEIPARKVVSIEHPGIVKNVTNAIVSLGGGSKVESVCHQDYECDYDQLANNLCSSCHLMQKIEQ